MKFGDKWTIYWTDFMVETYCQGSKVDFISKDEIVFDNLLMPPGSVIKTWYSKTNYQMMRIEPTLPLIDGEGEYKIQINIDTKEKENIFLRINYYDKYSVKVGELIIRDMEKVFRCPMATYSYTVQLINGGTTGFTFHSFIIQEVLDGAESDTKKTE